MRSVIRTVFMLQIFILCSSGFALGDDERKSQMARVEFERGIVFIESDEYLRAIELFTHSIELFPTGAAYCNLGICYQKLGAVQKAIDAYKSYLMLSPDAEDRGEVVAIINGLESEPRDGSEVLGTQRGAEEGTRSGRLLVLSLTLFAFLILLLIFSTIFTLIVAGKKVIGELREKPGSKKIWIPISVVVMVCIFAFLLDYWNSSRQATRPAEVATQNRAQTVAPNHVLREELNVYNGTEYFPFQFKYPSPWKVVSEIGNGNLEALVKLGLVDNPSLLGKITLKAFPRKGNGGIDYAYCRSSVISKFLEMGCKNLTLWGRGEVAKLNAAGMSGVEEIYGCSLEGREVELKMMIIGDKNSYYIWSFRV